MENSCVKLRIGIYSEVPLDNVCWIIEKFLQAVEADSWYNKIIEKRKNQAKTLGTSDLMRTTAKTPNVG